MADTRVSCSLYLPKGVAVREDETVAATCRTKGNYVHGYSLLLYVSVFALITPRKVAGTQVFAC